MWLHRRLGETVAPQILPRFPGKLQLVPRIDEDLDCADVSALIRRQGALETYLRALLQRPQLRRSLPLKLFLSPDFHPPSATLIDVAAKVAAKLDGSGSGGGGGGGGGGASEGLWHERPPPSLSSPPEEMVQLSSVENGGSASVRSNGMWPSSSMACSDARGAPRPRRRPTARRAANQEARLRRWEEMERPQSEARAAAMRERRPEPPTPRRPRRRAPAARRRRSTALVLLPRKGGGGGAVPNGGESSGGRHSLSLFSSADAATTVAEAAGFGEFRMFVELCADVRASEDGSRATDAAEPPPPTTARRQWPSMNG